MGGIDVGGDHRLQLEATRGAGHACPAHHHRTGERIASHRSRSDRRIPIAASAALLEGLARDARQAVGVTLGIVMLNEDRIDNAATTRHSNYLLVGRRGFCGSRSSHRSGIQISYSV